jgi:hypothetical protein
MRYFFLLVLLAGAALGIAYPLAASNVAGYEIGVWRVFARDTGFTPAEITLAPSDAPVSIVVDLRTDGALTRSEDRPLLLMEATGDGEPVLSTALDFDQAEARTVNPQTGETAYRVEADRLAIVEHDRYRFTFEPGPSSTERLISADLILHAGAFDLDPRAVPAGYILMAVGLVGFAATLFRRRRENPNSKPPPRWGRGGRN